MLDYLSAEWIDRLRQVASADVDLPNSASGEAVVTLQQHVTRAPGGDAAYYVTVGGGEVFVQAGTARRADLTFSQDYDTAVGVATGELNALDAVRDGRVTLTGDPGVLADHVEVLKALDGVFAEVRRHTAYPPSPAAGRRDASTRRA